MVRAVPPALRIAAWAFVVLTAIILLAPLVVVVGVSVSASQFIAFPPAGLTLRWYREVMASDAYLAAAALSLQVAVVVTLAATLVGGAAAIALHRRRLPGSQLLATAFLSPLVLPTIIYAIGMLMLWSAAFGPVSLPTLALSHTMISEEMIPAPSMRMGTVSKARRRSASA